MWRYGAATSLAYNMDSAGTILIDEEETAKEESEEILELTTEPYEAVVKSAEAVVITGRSKQPGEGNTYVCYYDENDEQLSFRFRIQRRGALPGEVVPAKLEWKTAARSGASQTVELPDTAYDMLPELNLLEVPVVFSPESEADKDLDYGLSQDKGTWYEVTIPFTSEGVNPITADGKTLLIAVALDDNAENLPLSAGEGAVHAEIRLVMRDLFDLD